MELCLSCINLSSLLCSRLPENDSANFTQCHEVDIYDVKFDITDLEMMLVFHGLSITLRFYAKFPVIISWWLKANYLWFENDIEDYTVIYRMCRLNRCCFEIKWRTLIYFSFQPVRCFRGHDVKQKNAISTWAHRLPVFSLNIHNGKICLTLFDASQQLCTLLTLISIWFDTVITYICC